MKIRIDFEKIVYHPETKDMGILFQNNVGTRRKYQYAIDWGEVVQQFKYKKDLDPQECFDRDFVIMGDL